MRIQAHLISVAIVAAAACSGTSSEQNALTQTTNGDVNAKVIATNCGVNPTITLDGKITLSGLGIRLTFQNNQKGTHENVQQLTNDVVIVPDGHAIAIPNFSSAGSVKNPFVWIQILDSNGNAVSGEVLLGRCAEGLAAIQATAPLVATAHIDLEGCDNTGSSVGITGSVSLSGLKIRVIFRDALDATSSTVVTAQTDVIVVGETFTMPKQPSRGGVGGNPWIYAQFIDGNGNALGTQVLLGRCVQGP